jgi:ankyrin repeat protein
MQHMARRSRRRGWGGDVRWRLWTQALPLERKQYLPHLSGVLMQPRAEPVLVGVQHQRLQQLLLLLLLLLAADGGVVHAATAESAESQQCLSDNCEAQDKSSQEEQPAAASWWSNSMNLFAAGSGSKVQEEAKEDPRGKQLRDAVYAMVRGTATAAHKQHYSDLVSGSSFKEVVNTYNHKGQTALMIAAKYGLDGVVYGPISAKAVIVALIAAGADPALIDKDGQTALMMAAEHGNGVLVEALLAGHADPDQVDPAGLTALIKARAKGFTDEWHSGYAKAVWALLQAKRGSLLMAAVANGDVDMLKAQLQEDAPVDVKTNDGVTALMIAAYVGDETVVQLLLQGGANATLDVQSKNAESLLPNERGTTALMIAADQGHVQVVRHLLEAGADASLKNIAVGEAEGLTAEAISFAKTPRRFTGKNGYSDIVELIQQHNAKEQHNYNIRKTAEEVKEAARKLHELRAGPAMDMLFYAIQSPVKGCNATMARWALHEKPYATLDELKKARENITGQTAIELATSKSGLSTRVTAYFVAGSNECNDIVDMIGAQIDKLEEQEDARINEKNRMLDEQKFPAIKTFRIAMAEFQGIESLRTQFSSIFKRADFNHKRKVPQCACAGVKADGPMGPCTGAIHEAWMITGNPGTGKTSTARRVTPALKEAGIIPRNNFVDVQKSEVIGTHVGGTTPKLQKLYEEHRGGVMFVDEAYTYKADNQFDKEALEWFLNVLTSEAPCEHKTIFIFAGYKKEMSEWEEFNPGFKRRFVNGQRFNVPDFSVDKLASITIHKLRREGLTVDADPEQLQAALSDMMEYGTTQPQRQQYGGSVAVGLTDAIRDELIELYDSDSHIVQLDTVCQAVKKLSDNKLDGESRSSHVTCPSMPCPSGQKYGSNEKSYYQAYSTQGVMAAQCIDKHPSLPDKPVVQSSPVPKPKTNDAATKPEAKRSIPESTVKTTSKATATAAKTATEAAHKALANPQVAMTLRVLSAAFERFKTWFAALPLYKQAALILATVGIIHYTCGPFARVVLTILLKLFRILCRLLMKLFNWLRKLCQDGCKDSCKDCKKTEEDEEFLEELRETDASTRAIRRARNLIRRGKRQVGGRQIDQAKDDSVIEEAMCLLWKEAPKDAALHGMQIEANLRKYQGRLGGGENYTAKYTIGQTDLTALSKAK